jgi:hypothetical protein
VSRRAFVGKIAPWQFDEYVRSEVDGHIQRERLAALEADPAAWLASLQFLLHEAKERLQKAHSLKGDGGTHRDGRHGWLRRIAEAVGASDGLRD